MSDRDLKDAGALLTAAYVISRRADEQGKKTFATRVLIRVLQRMAHRWDGGEW